MLPFAVTIQPGESIPDQIVYSVKKAIVSGSLRPGDKFPSVRALSQELRINPNTAHKVVAVLIEEQLLEVRPGIGTVITEVRRIDSRQRGELLGTELEKLVVEAKNLRIGLEEVVQNLKQHWTNLSVKGKK